MGLEGRILTDGSSRRQRLLALQPHWQPPPFACLPLWPLASHAPHPSSSILIASRSPKSGQRTPPPSRGDQPPAVGARRPVAQEFDLLPLNDKVFIVGLESVMQGVASGVLGGIAGLVYGGVAKRSLEAARVEGRKFFVTWGLFGAIYNLGMGLARSVRGQQDKYNSVIAACMSGAVFGREQGPSGMLAGCVQFAGFTYLLETFLVQPQQRKLEDAPGQSRTIEIPVENAR
ncbi:hypothetical protein CDCA_CDCA01G0359 [Cyanidium caldarium]|uniref:Mitochondrial import inner membrane translocase subunit TIM22 n=1 Tax=Cyanidium caldarium TaxID=2771 RepID=A0AAV9IQD6_CYACA|nr:hypothetical protein CDCA_CDCA01G0359 [Cyanidium caldarium]